MIKRIFVYKAVGLDPYINLATEKYLQDSLPDDAAVLYLWQNRDTAVIGVNQNPWYECRCELLERDGGHVARRLTGGGAVFHDEGNLNFSFIFNKDDYSLERNLEVIALACKSAGIEATVSGRNDITANGRKFSGNAFLTRGGKTLHHGTLLIRSDVEKLTKYLCPPKEKLAAKGVKSVRSRVINLTEINKTLTADKMSEYMLDAFERVMGQKAKRMPEIPREALQADIDTFSDKQFIYGRTFPFTAELERQVNGGRIRILLDVKGGIIAFAKVYTDSLDTLLPQKISSALIGVGYDEAEMVIENLTAYKRKSNRLAGFDYSSEGAYFLTVCVQDRKNILSYIPETVGEGSPLPELTVCGEIIEKYLKEIPCKFKDFSVDGYVIMPNHIHMIVSICKQSGRGDPSPTVEAVMGWFKYQAAKEINEICKTPGKKVFQRSYFDHIIRDDVDYEAKMKYILENPLKWKEDELY